MDKDNMERELKQEDSHEIVDLVARYNTNVVSSIKLSFQEDLSLVQTENSIYWIVIFVRLLMASWEEVPSKYHTNWNMVQPVIVVVGVSWNRKSPGM